MVKIEIILLADKCINLDIEIEKGVGFIKREEGIQGQGEPDIEGDHMVQEIEIGVKEDHIAQEVQRVKEAVIDLEEENVEKEETLEQEAKTGTQEERGPIKQVTIVKIVEAAKEEAKKKGEGRVQPIIIILDLVLHILKVINKLKKNQNEKANLNTNKSYDYI